MDQLLAGSVVGGALAKPVAPDGVTSLGIQRQISLACTVGLVFGAHPPQRARLSRGLNAQGARRRARLGLTTGQATPRG